MKKYWLVIFIAFLPWLVWGDRIELIDGTVIVGDVVSTINGKITVRNAFIGEVIFEDDAVVQMEISHPVNVADIDKNKEKVDECSVVQDNNSALSLIGRRIYSIDNIFAIWSEGIEDPTLPPRRKFGGEVYADMTAKSGNNRKFRGGVGYKFGFVGPIDKFDVKGIAVYERDEGNTTTRRFYNVAEYERNITQFTAWYLKNELEQDKIDKLDFRWLVAFGLAHNFIKNSDMTLRLKVGPVYQEKRYTNDADNDEDNNMGGEVNLYFERQIDGLGTFVCDVTYTPIFNSRQNYTIVQESSIDIPLVCKQPLSLRLGIRNEYDGKPAKGLDRLDTLYFARLVYKW